MKRWLCALLSLLILVPAVWAQEPLELTETFEDSRFTFQYPADWEQNMGKTVPIFSVPIASTGEPQNGISVESGGMGVLISLETDQQTTVEDYVTAQADDFGSDIFQTSEPFSYRLNGQPFARIDISSGFLDTTYLALAADEDTFVTVMLTGTPDQIRAMMPIMHEVLNTVRLTGDNSPVKALELIMNLPESYTRPDGFVSFNYPSDWEIASEEPTYTLVAAPNGVTIGISGGPYPADIPIEENMVVDNMNMVAEGLQEIEGVDLEFNEFVLNGRPATRLEALDPSGTLGLFFAFDLGNDYIANMSVIGDPALIAQIEPVLMGIAQSISAVE